VFRTCDGGQTWDKVLHRDADTGAIDISMDPNNPRILFAAFWQTRRNFWNLSSGGPGSGLFRSTDGGKIWDEFTRALRIKLALADMPITAEDIPRRHGTKPASNLLPIADPGR
jgi:photosystem II stability/assembly factor-like uncharacterized protein